MLGAPSMAKNTESANRISRARSELSLIPLPIRVSGIHYFTRRQPKTACAKSNLYMGR
jgi:hypothetical protein